MDHSLLLAFLLTLLAGLSTGIGSVIAFVTRHTNRRFLSGSLGFSAGVMLYVSLVELLPQAGAALQEDWGGRSGSWAAIGGFFGGMLLIAVIDRCIPAQENPHEAKPLEAEATLSPAPLLRLGGMTALAIAIHNFPEGLATFVSALQDPAIAGPIVVAIAIHNIPEGIAVSVPLYQATGSRRKAFVWSFLSGLAEPAGALLGWLLLAPVMSSTLFGLLYAGVAGIMVFISLDELLPAARAYGEHHLAIYGLIGGMAVMAGSLLLFE